MGVVASRIYNYNSTGNKTVLVVPNKFSQLSVRLVPTGISKIQHTIYPAEAAAADPDAVEWEDWPQGEITSADESRLIGAATAFRVVVVSGTAKLIVNFRDN